MAENKALKPDWDAPPGRADVKTLGAGPLPADAFEPQTPSGSETTALRPHGNSSADLSSDASSGVDPMLGKQRSDTSSVAPAGSTAGSVGAQPDAHHTGRGLTARDEALRRWAAAEVADTEHSYYGMRPLENDALGEAVAIATMLICFSWIYIGPMVTFVALPVAIFGHRPWAVMWLLTLAFLSVAPVKPNYGAWGRQYIWQTWRRYFRLRWVTPRKPFLAKDRHYLFLHFPHGVFPMGSFLSMALTGNEDLMGIPERTAGAVATVLLHLPGLRYFMVKMGCHPAGRASMVAMLRRRSVGIIPEGIAGLFRGASREREQVYWSPRLGICRIALQTGTPVVPIYDLGQSQVLSFAGSEGVSRRLRATVGAFWGRWHLPLPHKTDVIIAMGPPIAVKQIPNPSMAEVKALHAEIQGALLQLYNRHRHLLPALDDKELAFT